MSLFEWQPIYQLNIKEMDSQHQRLIAFMNDFYSKFLNSDTAGAIDILGELVDFTVFHFKEEEELMLKQNYADIGNHQEHHKRLLKLVTMLVGQYKKNPTESNGEEFAHFLKNWLSGHILGVDKKYAN